MPIIGVRIVNAIIIRMPLLIRADEPNVNRTGPIIPPTRACDDDIGSPIHVHIQIHKDAPASAQKTTYGFIN